MTQLTLASLRIRPIFFTQARKMSSSLDVTREKVIQSVKIDLLSKTQAAENEFKRKEIARSFICESLFLPTMDSMLTGYRSRYHYWLAPVSVPCPNSLNEYNVAVPTVEMYAYAVNATLGDDVYSEPSTT